MEVDEAVEENSSGAAGGGGGVSVEVELENKNTPEGEPKVKRKMKTPSQLEILEKTYAMETYPSEALRAELSVKLGLTDRQLQMWFCHRRLKDRKAPTEKKQKKSASSAAVAGSSFEGVVNNGDESKDSGSGLGLFGNVKSQQRVAHKVGTALPRISAESPPVRRFYEPPLAISEQRAIKFVEAQLGEPLREDGPILGMEFDPLPPGAFGTPIVASEQQKTAGRSFDAQSYERLDATPVKVREPPSASKALHAYQFLPEQPSVRNDVYERAAPHHYYGSPTDIVNARVPVPSRRSTKHSKEQVSPGYIQGQIPGLSLLPQQARLDLHLSPAPGDIDVARPIAPLVNVSIDSQHVIHPVTGLDSQIITPERRIVLDQERLERKRKTEEARIAKEVEAHEKRIRKELEKQDALRRKREEQMRKEMERLDRERRKEEERLLREKQREEERYQREQRREMERREKFLQKEYIRAEKMRLKEEMRREKEAAKLKAANDRATARRIAKESTELIEDERLELMELAALIRGLPSILALDSEVLQNLDLFKDKLPEFPPKSVDLKKPFGVQPWTDSEGNVGNLLMVWRFLIAFADVLGLWTFTLDEFTQALHDYEPRLLGEIHIALLRIIIKDIEDVVRTPATAMAANNNSAGTTAGGHPHIVEGAYAWGFDLLSWQHRLNPLTWPEILRQFALSAGFGPKLKKRKMKPGHLHDENEGDDGAETISNLRSGVAAENAVAIMQERGFSNRRSRHRLTPGTVKYAAFHILSVEGSKGLSILEVADKIQRSGLRDLTTSKTPEASISAALSRDTKLFERTAPSTYCVRSPYRKDPADAEAIVSEAREKIQLYQNGRIEEEEAEDIEKEVERDDDSESDDPDVDDLDSVAKLKDSSPSDKTSRFELTETQSVDDSIIDDCGSGEPWVQGLTEGEYADLCIEERLDALVALIGVANEGNAIRIALEERLEAANALKKQMWAEVQLDKRRMKDEHVWKSQHSSLAGNRSEQNFPPFTVEHRRSPLPIVDIKNESSSTNPMFQMVDLNEENYCNNILTEKNPLMQDISLVSDNLLLQQSVYAAEKSRSYLKAFIGHRAEEMYVYRSLPLGQDRRRNRYWQFITSPSRNDPGSGRIFVESCSGIWRIIDSEEGFDALLSSLDIRGVRESHLHSMLQSIGTTFKEAARRNSTCEKKVHEVRPKVDASFTINIETTEIMARYKDDEEWMWKECFDSNVLGAIKYGKLSRRRLVENCHCCHTLFSWEEHHCPSCHMTCSTLDKTFNFTDHVIQCQTKQSKDFDQVPLPPRITLLKAHLAEIEACLPSDAFESVWSDEYRNSWGMRLLTASTAGQLLQIVTLLEDNTKTEFLSANYETTSKILSCCKVIPVPGAIPVLPWIPQTTPAVALRLMELDTSIYYTPDQKAAHQNDNEARSFIKLPSVCSAPMDSLSQLQQDNCFVDGGVGRSLMKRGRGRPRGPTRTRGGRAQTTGKDKSRSRPRPGTKKGRRTFSSRQKVTEAVANVTAERDDKDVVFDLAETPLGNEGVENVGSSEEYDNDNDNDNDNGQASADEYDDPFVDEHVQYGMDREVDERVEDGDGMNYDEDFNDDEDEGDDDYYADGYMKSDYHDEGKQIENVDQSPDRSLGSESESSSPSEYSY